MDICNKKVTFCLHKLLVFIDNDHNFLIILMLRMFEVSKFF